MDFRDYLDVLRRRWRFVTVCVLLGLAGAALVTALIPRTYTATAQLFIATSDKTGGDAYQGGLFTQQRVKSYTRIVTSPAVLTGVISDLGLRTTPGDLAGKISAQAPLDTTLVDIRVTDGSATRAQAIADETARQFSTYIDTVEGTSPDRPPLVKATVVGGSQPPSSPTSPRPELNLAVGLLAGVAVGVGGAVLRRALDTTLRTPEDVGTHLGLTTLGAVPSPGRHRRHTARRADTARRTEALNQLRTQLRFGTESGVPASLLITGALPGEGRTRTALDLAESVARTGRRVVLVEADLRRPRLAEELGLRAAPGLADVIEGRAALHDALRSLPGGRTRVLPGGPVPADPSRLVSGPVMTQLVRALEADADLVVVDSPPLLSFADGAALASVTDGALFVVRVGKTRRDDARRALDILEAVRARVLGAVLTGTHDEGLADWQPPAEQPGPVDLQPPGGAHATVTEPTTTEPTAAAGRHREQAG